jgi:hypothetical protein
MLCSGYLALKESSNYCPDLETSMNVFDFLPAYCCPAAGGATRFVLFLFYTISFTNWLFSIRLSVGYKLESA